jgi:hypothetical protein
VKKTETKKPMKQQKNKKAPIIDEESASKQIKEFLWKQINFPDMPSTFAKHNTSVEL